MADSKGNGTGRVEVDMQALGPGWVYFQAGKAKPSPDDLPGLLSLTVIRWLKEHPMSLVRSTLPIVVGGNTVGIHLWFTSGP